MIALKAAFPGIIVVLYAAVICKPMRLRASTPTPFVAGVLPLGSSGVQARFPRGSPRAGPDDRHRPAGPALGESRGGGEPGGRTLQRRPFDRARRSSVAVEPRRRLRDSEGRAHVASVSVSRRRSPFRVASLLGC